jgi:hypothetical protein
MDDNLAFLVLAVVTFAAALNLFLTFRLAALVREAAAPPMTLPIGEAVAPFEGRARADGRIVAAADFAGRPLVLVFLSPGCPTCAGRIEEIVGILPGARRAGVALWIVPNDDRHDIAELVADTALAERVLLLDAAAREMLNPRRGAPFYVFIDEKMVARASNYVGDENWQSFVEQMRDVSAGDGARP